MIVIDASEMRGKSKMPEIEGAVVCDFLESITGADFMVSKMGMPVKNEFMLRKHLDDGAVLVQRKSGFDLVNSMGVRLNNSLAKMVEVTRISAQRVLLYTGTFSAAKSGAMLIDGRNSEADYWQVIGALSRWGERGGVVEWVQSDGMIPDWAAMKEKHLAQLQKERVKDVYPGGVDYPLDPPDPNDFLQLPRRVKDWRVLLAAIDGIGPKLANDLRDAILAHKEDFKHCNADSFLVALVWATDTTGLFPKVKGWGAGKKKIVRDALGLDDGFELSVEWFGYNKKEGSEQDE